MKPLRAFACLYAVFVLFFCAVVQAQPDSNPPAKIKTESFADYAPGSAAAPAWQAHDVGFEIRENNGRKTLQAHVAQNRGAIVWQEIPFASALDFEATMTPQKPGDDAAQWKWSGVALWQNENHFWHLALVEEPNGGRRYVEVSEMFAGVWNAQDQPQTRILAREQAPDFAWQYGVTYRLRLRLAIENELPVLRGEVWEGDQLRWSARRVLQSEDGQNRVVKTGRPAFINSHLVADFSQARVAEITPALEPLAEKIVFPPYKNAAKFARPKNLPAPLRATGFFRAQQIGKLWWLIDPNGEATLSIGTDHVNYQGFTSQALGYAPYHRNASQKYADEAAWAKNATARLSDWNFNVLGWNSSPSARRQTLAHTEHLDFGKDFSSLASLVPKTNWTGFPDVFDPRWARFCDLRAKEKCAAMRDDPWLTGYFLDNELEWWGKTWNGPAWGMALETAKQPATSFGKRALLALLQKKYQNDLVAFNADFSTALKNWDEFLSAANSLAPQNPHAQKALADWVEIVAQKYFQTATKAIRRYDPNHLILGSRFAQDAPDAAWRWAGKTCDVVSFNFYPRIDFKARRVPGLDEHLREHFALSRKPMMITEWSFPALDAKDSAGRAIPSTHGAGMRVDTQAQRAQAFSIFQQQLLKTPFVVGSHYFMWMDEPALGISAAFPENSNYGLVDDNDTPYLELTSAAREANRQALSIHAGNPFTPSTPAKGVLSAGHRAMSIRPGSEVSLQRDGEKFTVENGALRLESDSGALKISSLDDEKWVEMGRYFPLLEQVANGQASWVGSDKIEALKVLNDTPIQLVAEVVFTANASWKTRAFFIIKAGQPWFEMRIMSIENIAEKPLHWNGYFHYALSNIGGDAGDDVAVISNVPNYWVTNGAWRDEKLGVQFGVMAGQEDGRLNINFWKGADGIQHPDAFRASKGVLPPGALWSSLKGEPPVIVWSLRESPENPRPVSNLAHYLNDNPYTAP